MGIEKIFAPEEDPFEVLKEESKEKILSFDPEKQTFNLHNNSLQTLSSINNLHLMSSYSTPQDAIDNAPNNWIFVDGIFELDTVPLTVPSGFQLLGSLASEQSGGFPDMNTGSMLKSNTSGTNMIELQSNGSSGLPDNSAIIGLTLWGQSDLDNIIYVPPTFHSGRIWRNFLRFSPVAIDVEGGGIDINNNEINNQDDYGITLSDQHCRAITIRNNYFEGNTKGFVRSYIDYDYQGKIGIYNNRFEMNNVSDHAGTRLFLGDGNEKEFTVEIANNQWNNFNYSQNGLYIGAGTDSYVQGRINIHDNIFIGYDTDGNLGGKRAVHINNDIQPILMFHGNYAEGFAGSQ